jgi:eukaryotic-like serine/threonine-protein kinase
MAEASERDTTRPQPGQAETAGGPEDEFTVLNDSAKKTGALGDPAAAASQAEDVGGPEELRAEKVTPDEAAPAGGTADETGLGEGAVAAIDPADGPRDNPDAESPDAATAGDEAGQAEVAGNVAEVPTGAGTAAAAVPAGLGRHELNGRLLGERYRLVERIAVGGMGQVWRGTDEILGRTVAIKLLSAKHASDEQFRIRFQGEARYAASLSHPGIARVYDYGESDQDTSGFGLDPAFGLPYLVMELVEGEPLSAAIARDGRMPVSATLDLVAQAARALGAAHAAGIVHRDIKPGNLLITPDGQVKITDFGIARAALATHLTLTGMIMGTAQYVSPEQASARPVTSAADIYSLGVVAYECLAGQPPFTAEAPIALALAHVREQPPPLPDDVPPPVAALIGQMLAKEPADRPASAQAVAARASALKTTPADGTDAWIIGSDELTGPAAWFSDPSPTSHDSADNYSTGHDSADNYSGRINTAPIGAAPVADSQFTGAAARRPTSRRPVVRLLAAAALIVAATVGTLAALAMNRHPAAPTPNGAAKATHRAEPSRSAYRTPGLSSGGSSVPRTAPASEVHHPSSSPTTGSPSSSPTTSSSPSPTPTGSSPTSSPSPTGSPSPTSSQSTDAQLPLAGPQRPSTTTQDG